MREPPVPLQELHPNAQAISDEREAPTVWASSKGFVQAYSSEHLTSAIRLGMHQGNQAKVASAAGAALRFLHPRDWKERVEGCARVPGEGALRLGRVKLDCASMLLRRSLYAKRGPTFRYLGIDASPQRPGYEVLVCVERVIQQSEAHSLPHAQQFPDNVELRRMPPSILGHGRAGLAEKAQATMHQTWLEYGPSISQVRAANNDVRQILSDMGTEFGIADYADVLPDMLRGSLQGPLRRPTRDAPSFLFPLALAVPGVQHILDNLLRDSLHTLSWWPTWQTQAKIVCQWLHGTAHREFLQHLLPDASETTAALRKSLGTGCERFAEWRWQTLGSVTGDLRRMERAVRAAMDNISDAAELGTRDSSIANAFLTAVMDVGFWDRCRWLQDFVQPIKRLSGWIRGCDCHESQLLTGGCSCPWKGCRAPGLATRLQTFKAEVIELRQGALNIVGTSSGDTVLCTTRMLATCAVKFAWVSEPPFLIWQAGKPEVAQQFLEGYDETLREGATPHRVTAHFAGATSPLRRDMEAHAAGQGMSAKLRAEYLSYRWCMLDDTWVEAGHRDLSGISKRKTGSKMPFRFATLRLAQNMELMDSLDTKTLEYFHQVLAPKWRAIARGPGMRLPGPRRGLLDAPLGIKKVFQAVYRQSSDSRINWSDAFKHVLQPASPAREAPSERSMSDRLKSEFLAMVCQTEASKLICSITVVNSSDASRARAAADVSNAAAILDQSCKGHHRFFQIVVDGQTRRMKQVRGAAHKRMADMSFPVVIQEYATWAQRGSKVCDVYLEGFPQVKDLLRVAEWPVLRAGLRFWQQGPSDTSGCIQVSAPTSVSEVPWDFRVGPVPTILLLESLAAEGWRQHGQLAPLKEHTVDSDMIFKLSRNPLADKPYLQCLVCLPQLLSAAFSALPTGQPGDYYLAVLKASRPELIRTGEPARFYKQLAAGAVQSPALPLTDRPNPDVSSEDEIQGDFGVGNAQGLVSHGHSRKRRRAAEGNALGDAIWQPFGVPATSSDGQFLPLQDVDAAALRPDDPGQPGQTASSSALGNEALMQLQMAPRPYEAAQAARATRSHASTPAAGQARIPRQIVACVGEVNIVEESHLAPGQPGYYRRVAIRCPHKHHRGGQDGGAAKPCHKMRNWGPNQTAQFGHMEPVGFLAAWVTKGLELSDRESHMAYVPSRADIEQAMREHGWLQR